MTPKPHESPECACAACGAWAARPEVALERMLEPVHAALNRAMFTPDESVEPYSGVRAWLPNYAERPAGVPPLEGVNVADLPPARDVLAQLYGLDRTTPALTVPAEVCAPIADDEYRVPLHLALHWASASFRPTIQVHYPDEYEPSDGDDE